MKDEMKLKTIRNIIYATYDYCIVEKKGSLFKKMLRICEKIGFDEEIVGYLLYEGFTKVLDEIIEEDKGD